MERGSRREGVEVKRRGREMDQGEREGEERREVCISDFKIAIFIKNVTKINEWIEHLIKHLPPATV